MIKKINTQHNRYGSGNSHCPPRGGFVLILVVVVIALLMLVAFTFSELMFTERKAALLNGRQAQAFAAAESGIELAKTLLLKEKTALDQAGGWYNNSALFRGALIANETNIKARSRVTLVATIIENGEPTSGIRFGLENESAKLNLNNLLAIVKANKKSSSSTTSSTGASGSATATGSGASGSGATGSSATGSGATGSGATGSGATGSGATGSGATGSGATGSGATGSGASGSGATGAASTTGATTSTDAASAVLMNLPGMTQEIAEAILDWLDSDEQPRSYGAEIEYYSMLSTPYEPKNGPLDSIEELLLVRGVTPALLFGSDINRNGRIDADEPADPGQVGVDITDGSMLQGWAPYLTLYSKEKNVQSTGDPKIDLNQSDMNALNTALQDVLTPEQIAFIIAYRQNGPYTGTQAGVKISESDVDLSKQGSIKLTSVLDLIGAKVQVQAQAQASGSGGASGQAQTKYYDSPFSSSPAEMLAYLPILMDATTVSTEKEIVGRININQAPKAVLMCIPGITPEMVDEIIAQRTSDPTNSDINRQHETWLLSEGIVTLQEMKDMLPYVTCGGDVYRVQSIGYFENGGVAARIEAIIDAGTLPATVLFWRDISHLGRGFSLEELGISSGM